MQDLDLTYAGMNYADRLMPMIDGTVRPQGIAMRYINTPIGSLFKRVANFGEFDVTEMSLATYMNLVARNDERFVGIPVFTSRCFRHSWMFVHRDSGIKEPKDLVGKKVGVPEYEMTAGVWQRALLQHDYGVEPKDIRWFEGGLAVPGYFGRNPIPPPAGVSIEIIPEDKSFEGMAGDGELDALFCPKKPPAFLDGSGRMRRLFPNWVEVEQEYYRRTNFFPIMHLVVIKRAVYEQHKWVAISLLQASMEAQRIGWKRVSETTPLGLMLPWLERDLDEIDELMGTDHWPYGLAKNHEILDAICQYHHEQGLSERRLTPEELFTPETRLAPMDH